MKNIILKSAWIETPLGSMLALADENALFSLEFSDRIEEHPEIIPEKTDPIKSIEAELKSYFKGFLKEFKTPLQLSGTAFQKMAWNALLKIPYGETRSYLEQAAAIGKKSAYRAVANANGANKIAIVIPCHRIINHNGALGGYSAGLDRKKFLLELEKNKLKELSSSF
jgi:AraC family transcriptional regulator of adaptative response/methylated-DNA-[protein]-cysteine methyltransferase